MHELTIKDRIKYIMWLVGLRSSLPAKIINSIKVSENYDVMVNIRGDNSIYFSAELLKKDGIYLRQEVYNRIKSAQKMLPHGVFFKLYCAYRSRTEQQELWQENYNRIKQENPNMTTEQIEQKTKAICADPRYGYGGHQTGGAVDIGLCDDNGIELDMGTAYLEDNSKTVTKAVGLSKSQQNNRRILQKAMQKVGFVNYPQEWWHYCYGDKMWAAYSKRGNCFYGLADKSTISFKE